ncbi:MAG: head-tail connector protein [Pseudomonadota bacterium]
MALTIVVQPAREPVTLEEIKDHLRITETDTGAEDAVLLAFITAARRYCEKFQNRAYIHQTWRLYLPKFPDEDFVRIPLPPLVSLSLFRYYGLAGTVNTLSTSVYYTDGYDEPARVYLKDGQSWPTETLRPAAAVELQFLCGYGSAATSVPQEVKQAIKMMVGHMYEHREATDIKEVLEAPPGFHAMLWMDRVLPI